MKERKLWLAVLVIVASLGAYSLQRPPVGSAPAAVQPDTWQRSKECAEQAERFMGPDRFDGTFWTSHYSNRYGKCFVSMTSQAKNGPFVTTLYDAFERADLAESSTGGGGRIGENLHVDYMDARRFIEEHMKN
jgi:hypothetical protein